MFETDHAIIRAALNEFARRAGARVASVPSEGAIIHVLDQELARTFQELGWDDDDDWQGLLDELDDAGPRT